MISFIVRQSIRYPGVVVALALTVVIYGFYVLTRANLDVFPEFSPSQVVIQTEAPGLSAELVERQVTQPIENALAGASGVEHIRSQSIPGFVGGQRAVPRRLERLSQPPDRRRAARRARQSAAARCRAAGDDTAHLVGEHRAGRRAHVRHALADGDSHAGRLDAAPASARGARAWPRSTCSAATCVNGRCRSIPSG